MSAYQYIVGGSAVFTATFENVNPDNPPVVQAWVKDPSGTETQVTPSNPSNGVYQHTVNFTAYGNWYVRFASTGSLVAAVERYVNVEKSAFSSA